MANEFAFGDKRENVADFYSDVFKYLVCAVACGSNPKYMHERVDRDTVVKHFGYLRSEHVPMLADAIGKVCDAAEENVKNRNGKLSFKSAEEMERYQRDALIVKRAGVIGTFRKNVLLAIDGIPKDRRAYMLRGLAMYLRFFDEGDDFVVTDQYMLRFADYLMTALAWICDNKARIWRTCDLWASQYGHNYSEDNLYGRREFLSLPSYCDSEREAFVRIGLIVEDR